VLFRSASRQERMRIDSITLLVIPSHVPPTQPELLELHTTTAYTYIYIRDDINHERIDAAQICITSG